MMGIVLGLVLIVVMIVLMICCMSGLFCSSVELVVML